jgi:hypothetical protein
VERFQASLRDATGAIARRPGVETPGYYQRSLRDPENVVGQNQVRRENSATSKLARQACVRVMHINAYSKEESGLAAFRALVEPAASAVPLTRGEGRRGKWASSRPALADFAGQWHTPHWRIGVVHRFDGTRSVPAT